jgi:hypothetical protein
MKKEEIKKLEILIEDLLGKIMEVYYIVLKDKKTQSNLNNEEPTSVKKNKLLN